MTAIRFNVIFEGKTEPGHDRDEVRRQLEDLFEFDTRARAILFTGRPIVLGESMDADTAKAFRLALAGTGATTHVEAVNDAPTGKPAPERRQAHRRLHAPRRAQARPNAIQPDRRDTKARRR